MSLTIYHNPRCSKSRQTLALLEEHGKEFEILEYLKTAPSVEELKELLEKLGMKDPRELMRKKEALYKELNLSDSSLSEEALLSAMSKHPQIIERPIVIHNHQAAIGRPPETILSIL